MLHICDAHPELVQSVEIGSGIGGQTSSVLVLDGVLISLNYVHVNI